MRKLVLSALVLSLCFLCSCVGPEELSTMRAETIALRDDLRQQADKWQQTADAARAAGQEGAADLAQTRADDLGVDADTADAAARQLEALVRDMEAAQGDPILTGIGSVVGGPAGAAITGALAVGIPLVIRLAKVKSYITSTIDGIQEARNKSTEFDAAFSRVAAPVLEKYQEPGVKKLVHKRQTGKPVSKL